MDFDIYRPCEPNDDFYKAWSRFQATAPGPVVWSRHNGGHWIPTTGEGISDVFRDHDRYSSDHIVIPVLPGEQLAFGAIAKDPPIHAVFRRFLTTGLTPKVVREREPQIRALAIELIETFVKEGRCDFISQYSDILPLCIFLDLVALPSGHRQMLSQWSNEVVIGSDLQRREAAFRNLGGYLAPVLESSRNGSADDLFTRLVNTKVDGRDITLEEAVGAALHLVIAGLDTVASLPGHAFRYLARNAALQKQLSEQPSLIPAAAQEFLRRFPVVTMSRRVRDDVVLHGVQLKQNDMVSLPTMLYNWDPAVTPEPLSVQLDRPAKETCTFGIGIHRCRGAVLGRSEVTITLEEWFKRIPSFRLRDESDQRVNTGAVAVVGKLELEWPV